LLQAEHAVRFSDGHTPLAKRAMADALTVLLLAVQQAVWEAVRPQLAMPRGLTARTGGCRSWPAGLLSASPPSGTGVLGRQKEGCGQPPAKKQQKSTPVGVAKGSQPGMARGPPNWLP
jgi:hypothetical protein